MFKQIFAGCIAMLGSTGIAAAQSDVAPAVAAPASCSPPAVADTVELAPVPASNLMTVPVQINGAAKLFLLDLGRTQDQVSDATVGELHLPQSNLTTGIDGFAGMNTPNQFRATMVDVKSGVSAQAHQERVLAASFTIGGATVKDVQFLVANDRDLGKSKPYDGLLTTGLFPHFDLNLDFGGKKLTFLAPTNCQNPVYWPHNVVAVVPMTVADGKITVPVTIDGHQIDAIIDTKSDHTVMRRSIAERMFGLKADTPETAPAGDLRDGLGQRVYQHTFPQIAFEGVVAGNVPVLIQTNSMVHKVDREHSLASRAQLVTDPSDFVPNLALGMDVLHQLHLYIAFDQNKIFVTPAG